jgi:hypothetical protein
MRLILHHCGLLVDPHRPRRHSSDTALAKAEFNTIRIRLLKLGARVIEMASRVRLALAAACPEASLIRHIAAALMPVGP